MSGELTGFLAFFFLFLHQTEFRQRNAGKRSGSSKAKEADRKGKRKEPPTAEVEDEQDATKSDESEDGADD